MNEQLQNALTEILNKANSGIDAGVGFLSDQIPDVIHQLLVWKAVMSGLSMITAIITFSAISYVYVKFFRVVSRWSKEGELFDHPEAMFAIFGLFLYLIPFGLFSLDWLQIWLAPKIYLVEYAAQLAK